MQMTARGNLALKTKNGKAVEADVLAGRPGEMAKSHWLIDDV